jgi:hypothetical protein
MEVFKFSIVMYKKEKMAVFLYLAPRSLIDIDRRLRGAYSLYHQKKNLIWNKQVYNFI